MRTLAVSLLLVTMLLGCSAFCGEIHEAFAKGSDEKVLALMKSNPSRIEEKDTYDCTPLHYAARYGRLETGKWLIEHKANVNTVAYNNFTPMHVVADGGMARLLIQAGADLTKKDTWGKTPLQNAIRNGLTNVWEAILDSGFPIDLTSAIRLGRRDLAKKMIKENPTIAKEVEPDSDLEQNTSPLGVAASQGDKEMVEFLLSAGAPVDAATLRPLVGKMTALCNAVWAGHYEIAELLCKSGADCNVTGGKFYPRLLDGALKHSDKKMVDLLIKYGAKPSPPYAPYHENKVDLTTLKLTTNGLGGVQLPSSQPPSPPLPPR